MIPFFCHEDDPRVPILREQMRKFYNSCPDYTAFTVVNDNTKFWDVIKKEIILIIAANKKCSVLEFGAARSGFGEYIKELRSSLVYDVQDVTVLNREYLTARADNVYIGDIQDLRNKYDIIFSTFVWEHVSAPQAVLNSLMGMLNPGGSIFIASPRYDFPFYIGHSCAHLPFAKKALAGLWLLYRRCRVICGARPDFFLNTDAAVFHKKWEMDFDAIHIVSLFDMNRFLSKRASVSKMPLPFISFRHWLWAKLLLLFVQIKKDK